MYKITLHSSGSAQITTSSDDCSDIRRVRYTSRQGKLYGRDLVYLRRVRVCRCVTVPAPGGRYRGRHSRQFVGATVVGSGYQRGRAVGFTGQYESQLGAPLRMQTSRSSLYTPSMPRLSDPTRTRTQNRIRNIIVMSQLRIIR